MLETTVEAIPVQVTVEDIQEVEVFQSLDWEWLIWLRNP